MEKIILGDRIKAIRKAKNLSQQALAVLIGTSNGYICEVEKGKKSPGSEFLFRLSQKTEARLEWLKDGQGEMFQATEKIPTSSGITEIVIRYAERLEKENAELKEKLLKYEEPWQGEEHHSANGSPKSGVKG